MAQLTDHDTTLALTPAQLTVLRHICEGKTSKEIAADLGVAKRTVDYHIHGIYQRLGISNRIQALKHAQQLGIVT